MEEHQLGLCNPRLSSILYEVACSRPEFQDIPGPIRSLVTSISSMNTACTLPMRTFLSACPLAVTSSRLRNPGRPAVANILSALLSQHPHGMGTDSSAHRRPRTLMGLSRECMRLLLALPFSGHEMHAKGTLCKQKCCRLAPLVCFNSYAGHATSIDTPRGTVLILAHVMASPHSQ